MPALSTLSSQRFRRALRGPLAFTLTLLAVEFLDELVFGALQAAWPLVRDDLSLTYSQIGLLLGVPTLVSSLVEPVLGVLADTWKRWLLIVGGGFAFTLSLLLAGNAPGFALLLAGFMLMYPASGALVSLSQASLMDLDPQRHEHLMARWTLAGSVGVLGGPLLLGAAITLGRGWREVLMVLAALLFTATLAVWRQPLLRRNGGDGTDGLGLREGLRRALQAWRRADVRRWLVLLEFSDFMLDVLLGFLALYLVDVVGVSPALAGVAVAVWTGFGLLGDALLIPVLERVRGLIYLRYSALIMLCLYPAFLLVPWWWAKLGLLACMGVFNAGWYAILQGNFYSALPGQSGTAVAVNSSFGLVTGFVPALLGWIAHEVGLPVTMWLLLLGPIALLIGLPRGQGQG